MTRTLRKTTPEEATFMWSVGAWDDDKMIGWLMERSQCSREKAQEMLSFMRKQNVR